MELLPTLLGALPDLGVAGIVLVVLYVGQRVVAGERAHFRQERTSYQQQALVERTAYREEAREDRAGLKAEIAELKAENRELEERLNEQWRSRPIRPQDGGGGWSSPA